MKQQTLDGEILGYLPDSPSDRQLDDSVYKFNVFFRLRSDVEIIEMERVYIQDCERQGVSAVQRARFAAMEQTPFDVGQFVRVERAEETDWAPDTPGERRAEAYL